jgi:hypothetical protein
VHDPSYLAHDDDLRPARIEGAQQRQRVEADGTVRRDGAESVVGHALEGDGAPEPARLGLLLRGSPPEALYDLASVAWYVRRGEGPPGSSLVAGEPKGDLLAPPALYRSSTALPRAFLVHRASEVSEREAREALFVPSSQFAQEALIELGPEEDLPYLEDCEAPELTTLAHDGLSRLVVETHACGAALLVVTDAFFPGWTARVDGAEAPVLRADYLVRAVPVPAGHHRVELTYRPASFAVGAALSAAATLAWAMAMAWGGRKLPLPPSRGRGRGASC